MDGSTGKESEKEDSNSGQPSNSNNTPDSFDNFADAVSDMVEEAVKDSLDHKLSTLARKLKREVLSFVEANYGEHTQIIKTKFEDERLNPIEDEPVHEKMQEVLNFVMAKEPVYLVGPAGCGKNHICKQIAQVLGLPFYYSNAITQEYKLTGFTDANGNYQETQFYKAFKEGGIFLLDEMDASLPDALIILNAAISNGYFDFPAPIGFVEAHPDFRVIAAGNTWGNGADLQYVGRNQLDMASLDRFAVVTLDYSPQVEASLCPNREMQSFLREYRKAIFQNGLLSVVSYRAFKRMYIMEDRFDNLYEWLDCCLCKGLCKDDLLMIHNQIKKESKYKDALKELASSRRE